jgi:hypothetical protein
MSPFEQSTPHWRQRFKSCKTRRITQFAPIIACIVAAFFIIRKPWIGQDVASSWQQGNCRILLEKLSEDKLPARYLQFKQVFVFSHRRSGTHLTINLLRFGFKRLVVWKANHASCSNCDLIVQLQQCGGFIIHAYRNPVDVALSLHSYTRSFNSAAPSDFVKFLDWSNCVPKWSEYTTNCFAAPGVLSIPFELTRNNARFSHRMLKDFLHEPGSWSGRTVPRQNAVKFSGGQVGEWSQLADRTIANITKQSLVVSSWTPCSCSSRRVSNDGHECRTKFKYFLH